MLVYTKKEEPGIKHNIDNWHVVKGKLLNNYNYSNFIATNNNCRLEEEAAAHINTFPFGKLVKWIGAITIHLYWTVKFAPYYPEVDAVALHAEYPRSP